MRHVDLMMELDKVVAPKAMRRTNPARAKLRQAIASAFLAGTVADRLGTPLETKSRAEILEKNGGNEVTTYVDPREWRIADPRWGTFTRIGEPSDDTGLLVSSLRAIRRGGGIYHPLHAAMSLINVVQSGAFQGWGGTVTSQAAVLASYFTSLGKGRGPLDPPTFEAGQGFGNGAAMRAAPIIWSALLRRNGWPMLTYTDYRADRSLEKVAVYRQLSDPSTWSPNWKENGRRLEHDLEADERLTHLPNSGGVGSVAFYEVMRDLLPLSASLDPNSPTPNCAFAALPSQSGMRYAFPQLLLDRRASEHEQECYRHLRTCSIENLVAKTGNGGAAAESLTLAVWIAIRHTDSVRAAIIEAVNAGGDTDSIGCLVGLLVGFYSRTWDLPDAWIEPIAEELLELARTELVPFLDAHP